MFPCFRFIICLQHSRPCCTEYTTIRLRLVIAYLIQHDRSCCKHYNLDGYWQILSFVPCDASNILIRGQLLSYSVPESEFSCCLHHVIQLLLSEGCFPSLDVFPSPSFLFFFFFLFFLYLLRTPTCRATFQEKSKFLLLIYKRAKSKSTRWTIKYRSRGMSIKERSKENCQNLLLKYRRDYIKHYLKSKKKLWNVSRQK